MQPTDNLTSWEEHIQGLRCYSERKGTDYEDPLLIQAHQHFENAIKLDPAFSDSHAYLSYCHIWEVVQNISKDPKQSLSLVLASAQKDENLNPENP